MEEGVVTNQPLLSFWDEGFDEIRELPKKNRVDTTCLNKKRFEGAKRKLQFNETNHSTASKSRDDEKRFNCLVCSESFVDQKTLVEHQKDHIIKYGHKCIFSVCCSLVKTH